MEQILPYWDLVCERATGKTLAELVKERITDSYEN
jgi:hypothetical protein